MAPIFRAGKDIHFSLDSTAGTLVDLSSGLDDITLSRDLNALEKTTFGKSYRVYIPGLRGATISCSGHFSSTHAVVLDGIFGSTTSTTQSFEFSPDGSTATGRHLLKGEAIMTSLEYTGSVDDNVGMSFDLQITGAVTSTNH